MSSLVHPLLSLHGWGAYALVGALCFGEVALFIGFFLPGEIAVIYGGALASLGHVTLAIMLPLVVVAAVAGDQVGFVVGRRFGSGLLRHRPLRGSPEVERARTLLERRGVTAVFLGRFVAIVRALIPGLAGISELSSRRFFWANFASGVIWAGGYCFAGYAAGASYQKVVSRAGAASLCLFGLAVTLGGVFVYHRLRRRAREREDAAS